MFSFIKKIFSAAILGVVLYFGGVILFHFFFVLFLLFGSNIRFWEENGSIFLFLSYVIMFFIVIKIYAFINKK